MRRNQGVGRPSRHAAPALQILHERYYGKDPARWAVLEQEREKARIARQIYELRTAAGLTQAQLADRVGTTASAICRLEDTDYGGGPTLRTLWKVASALDCRVEVNFLPKAARKGNRL